MRTLRQARVTRHSSLEVSACFKPGKRPWTNGDECARYTCSPKQLFVFWHSSDNHCRTENERPKAFDLFRGGVLSVQRVSKYSEWVL